MKKEDKKLLMEEHYLDASRALYGEEITPLREPFASECLLQWAFEEIDKIKGMKQVDNITMGFWKWVEELTSFDVAWHSNVNHNPQYARSEAAYAKLLSFAGNPGSELVLKAAETFKVGRDEYSAQLNSMINS